MVSSDGHDAALFSSIASTSTDLQSLNLGYSFINLPTGSRARAIVTSIGVVQSSDNQGYPIIDWLLLM